MVAKKMSEYKTKKTANFKQAKEVTSPGVKEHELLSKSQEETKQALLNVMEDLEAARAVMEVEKAKDEAMLASIGEA